MSNGSGKHGMNVRADSVRRMNENLRRQFFVRKRARALEAQLKLACRPGLFRRMLQAIRARFGFGR